ncbi:MAG TPA: helix-turn-helix domain-containing protein [Candidatus Avipropionibacterium avicola]|uniref:Helix-turn-helix domain-containing protein n=1 Tax=Candidatus Avipropionibacterium avicola TaxID=2840701 RepID=A0A9D1GZC2_9ACTN|nr:helix-turn-helix domain-containing protein [Candidatus Avipropionibacterium avicola]
MQHSNDVAAVLGSPSGSLTTLPVPGAGPSGSNQSLARGLYVLRRLVEVDEPWTLAQLATELGTHQSSVSRLMATLVAAGYARKDEKGRFVPDYGIISLATRTNRLPLLSRPWPVFEQLAKDHPRLSATVAMLWRGQLLYGLRSGGRGVALLRQYPDYPLHRSSPGLRLLLDMPEPEAVELLESSRQRHGWSGDPAIVPADAAELLARARERCEHEVLMLSDGWAVNTALSGAIPVRTSEPHPVALAIVDKHGDLSPDELRLVLHTVRRDLELAFHQR